MQVDYNVRSTLARQHSCLDALQSHSKNFNVLTVEIVGIPMQNFIAHSSMNTAQVSKTLHFPTANTGKFAAIELWGFMFLRLTNVTEPLFVIHFLIGNYVGFNFGCAT